MAEFPGLEKNTKEGVITYISAALIQSYHTHRCSFIH